MKGEKKQEHWDLVSPLIELGHEFLKLMGQVIWLLLKRGTNALSGGRPPLKLLEIKSLGVKKTTAAQDSLGIDVSTRKVVRLKEIDFRRHSFIVGGSGFGKTNLLTILQENSLEAGRPIIFIDPKGDLETLNCFKKLCLQYKRQCYIFSEYHPDSIALNPLLEGSINHIVSRLMNSFDWSNEFYRGQSERALFQVCKNLKDKNEVVSIQSILHELSLIESDDIAGIISNLTRIQESDFARHLNTSHDGLTISKVREERACLYIGLSLQGYGETARTIGRLFLGELLYNSYMTMRTSAFGEGLKNPLSVHFDELGALLVPDFIELLNKCRSAGIELTMAVQSPADLSKYDDRLPTQIVENSGNLFVLKQRVDDSAAFFSKAIGTITTTKSTHVTEDGETQSRGSVREVYELLAHPDIIKNLGVGQCVLLQQGPTRVRVLNIRNRDLASRKQIEQAYDPKIL